MEFIPTNDVFHHFLNLLRLTKNRELVIEIFASQGKTVSANQLRGWSCKTGTPSRNYRKMPKEMLNAFITGLYEARLVSIEGDEDHGQD